MLDDHNERYVKTCAEMSKFFVLQYGLSIFSQKKNDYTASTYNIFISPTLPSDDVRHRDFTRNYQFLGSTMDFLASHQYDFNTTFTEGVPFLTRLEEEKLLVSLLLKFYFLFEGQNRRTKEKCH